MYKFSRDRLGIVEDQHTVTPDNDEFLLFEGI